MQPTKTNTSRNGLKFVGTTAILFVFIFGVLNAPAYLKRLRFWLDAPTTVTAESRYLEAKVVATPQTAATLPPIDFDIAPPDNRLIVERLGINAPIQMPSGIVLEQKSWSAIEDQIQDALKAGVVLFPGTARPGQLGNTFITGHSSYYPWDNGRYKDIFALLPKIVVGDEIVVYYNQQRFTYLVTEMKEVKPTAVDVLRPTDDYRLTLMTCTPVGTTLKRLIITAELQSS